MGNRPLGQTIRKLRKEKGLTLAQLAGQSFTKGYISQVELGKVEPSFKLLTHIADQLDLKVEQLLSHGDDDDFTLAKMENDLLGGRYDQVDELGKILSKNRSGPIAIKAKLMQAKATYHLGRYGEALDHASDVLQSVQSWSQSYQLEAYALMGLALFAQKDFKSVIAHYDRAFTFAQESGLGHSDLLANMYLNQATAYQILGDYQVAVSTYEKTLDFAKEHHCQETVLDAYMRLGFCYYKLGNLATGKAYIFDALRINKVLGIQLPQAETLLILAYILIDEENHKAAIQVLSKALDLFREVNRQEGIVESLYLLASLYQETPHRDRGKDMLLESLKLTRTHGMEHFEADLIKRMATTCMDYGLHEEANALFSALLDQ